MSTSNEKMKNPYEKDGVYADEVRVPRGAAWFFIALFLAICVVPPVLRNISDPGDPLPAELGVERGPVWRPVKEFFNHPSKLAEDSLATKRERDPRMTRSQPSITDHLGAFEGRLDEAGFRKPPMRAYQRLATTLFREGNSKVHVGRGGTLFFKPGIDGIIGYGPLKAEPDTVARDPNRPPWNSPEEAILKFHAQLKERGVELMLVPVPVKPMIYPERAGAAWQESPMRHPDTDQLYESLRADGIDVVDLADPYFEWRKERTDLYLRQDTHWTPATMEKTADFLTERITSKPWFGDLEKNLDPIFVRTEREHDGDLARMLHGDFQKILPPETHEISIVRDKANGEITKPDRGSRIALLGDSFVNIFNDPNLGFGPPQATKEERNLPIGAGFAQHLSAQLGVRLDTYLANGGGASDVRTAFGKRSDNDVRAKKLVVWVLASRDLFLSETPAGKAGVRFTDTVFNSKKSAETAEPAPPAASGETTNTTDTSAGIEITAQMTDRSPNGDPTATPYTESLYASHFEISEEDQKKLGAADPEIVVYFWSFRDRKIVPTGEFSKGESYTLKLRPWSEMEALQTINRNDSLGLFLDEFFAVEAKLAEE